MSWWKQCVAVGRGGRDGARRDRAVRAEPVLHIELLAQAVAELLRDRAPLNVRSAARGETDRQPAPGGPDRFCACAAVDARRREWR